jgi:hypothetical protein
LIVFCLALVSGGSVGAAEPEAPGKKPAEEKKVRLDRYGDPLPEAAIARLGTLRLRHTGRVFAVAFSPNGKVLASGGGDNLIRLWDPTTGQKIRLLAGHLGCVRSLAFSPDGKVLASAGDDWVRLWDVSTGKELGRPVSARSNFVVFAPKGKLLAYAGAGGPPPPQRQLDARGASGAMGWSF